MRKSVFAKMKLTKRLMNPAAISSIYGEFPVLAGSEITSILMSSAEPRLRFTLSTNEKPSVAPRRWPSDYDVIYFELSFIGVRDLSIENWGSDNVVKRFSSADQDESTTITVLCENQSCISFSCDWIRVESIKPGLIGSP